MAYVDLAKKSDTLATASPAKPSYPTLFLSDVPQLDDLPDGEFTFEAVGKVVRHTETEDESGDRHCDCTIEIHSIEPKSVKGKQSKADLGDALDKIAEDKMAEDDVGDE